MYAFEENHFKELSKALLTNLDQNIQPETAVDRFQKLDYF